MDIFQITQAIERALRFAARRALQANISELTLLKMVILIYRKENNANSPVGK